MKLSCPSCGAKYSIADEKVQSRLAKIRCRKCSATIIVDGKVDPPNVYTSDGASQPSAEAADAGGGVGHGEYSVDFGDNDQRTMTTDDIVAAYRRGEVTHDTYVWAEGMGDWSPISAVPELSQALGAATAAAPAAQARTAARSGAGRGSAHDLFGGIDSAGSEEDVMTSAPQAAAPAPVAATGARNESSVLFSLSALTAASGPTPVAKASSPAATDDKGDDSGLIDLKALTSAVGAQAPASPLVLGTAPLGMASPLGGMTAPAIVSEGPPPRQQSSKTGLYVGGAIVLVGALIAGAIVMSGNREAPAALASAAPMPVAPTPAPTPEPKKEEPTAQPPSTGTAAAEAAPKEPETKTASTTKVAVRSKKSSGGSSAAASPAAEKPAAAAPPPSEPASGDAPKKKKKAEKTCNCSPGDLMCAMKCASGG